MYDFKIISEILSYKGSLTQTQERNLFEQYWNNGITKEYIGFKLIRSDMKMICRTARMYHRTCKLPLIDLINEGVKGYLTAIDKYDNVDYKFNTYAIYWIKAEITEYIERNAYNLNLPHNKMVDIKKALKANRETNAEIPFDIQKLMDTATNFVSLDSKVDNEESSTYSDIIEDLSAKRNFNEIDNISLKNFLLEKIDMLQPLEKITVKVHFGFYDYDINISDLTEKLNMSYNNLKTIRDNGIYKLKQLVKKETIGH